MSNYGGPIYLISYIVLLLKKYLMIKTNHYIYFQDALLELCREKPNRINVWTHSNISLRLHYVKVILTVTFRLFVVELRHWTIPSVYHLTIPTSSFWDMVGGLPKWTRLFPSPSPALFLSPLCWPLLHQFPRQNRQITSMHQTHGTIDIIWMSKRYLIINGEKKNSFSDWLTRRLSSWDVKTTRLRCMKVFDVVCRNCKNALQINRIRMW